MSNKQLTKQKISNDQIKQIMDLLLKHAKENGATDAMVSVNYDSGFSVDVRMREVETVAFHENKGVRLSVYIGNQKGSASGTDLSPEALNNLANIACNIARISAPDPCFGLPDRQLMSNAHPDLDLYYPWSITPPIAIKKALACEELALESDSRIFNSDGVQISTYDFCDGFANSYGSTGIVHSTRHGISCSLLAKDKDSVQRDYDYTTAIDPNCLLSIEHIAKSATERAINRLHGKKLKTQKIPVLFSSRIANTLFSHFINAINGNNLYKRNSFLLDSLNQEIFPKQLRIHEQPYLPKALGSSPFDGEGVPTRNNVFIENGKLLSYMLNSYSARRLGLTTTANANGVHNLTIDPTAGNFEDLLKLMNKGLLVTELMGQGVNILTGDYSRGASGFWVENGKIEYPVTEITIAGNLKEMFKNILAVGTDLNPNIATRCGSVLVAQMMVAGH